MDPHVHLSVSVMRLLLMPPRLHLSPTTTSRLHQLLRLHQPNPLITHHRKPLRQTHNPLRSPISNPLKLLHLRSLHLHIIHRNLLQRLRNLRIHLLPKGKFTPNKTRRKTRTTNTTRANKTAAGAEIVETTNLQTKMVNPLIPLIIIMWPLLTKTLIARPSRLKTPICAQTILVLFAGSMATTHIFVHIWSEFGNFWLRMYTVNGRQLLKHHPTCHNLNSHLWCCKTPYQPKT